MNNKYTKLLTIFFSFLLFISLTACGEVKKKSVAKKADNTVTIRKEDDKESKINDEKKVDKNIAEAKEDTDKNTKKEDTDINENAEENIVEISEKIFLQKINDIYFNFDDYKDSTIIVEGMFSIFVNYDNSETRPVVYRNGPGCCGNDGWGGFFLIYDGEYPQENEWIRVIGKPVLTEDELGGLELFLEAQTIEVKLPDL